MDDSETAVRSQKVVSMIGRFVLALVISLTVVGAVAAAEKVVSGFLTVNGKKVQLLYAYVDNVQPDEPIVVLSNKPLPQEAIPFVSAKLVKNQGLYVIAFTISSKDKKLVNGYGMLNYPGSDGVGFGRVEEGGLKLSINKLDDNVIEGKISTSKPVKLSEASYSFDLAFKVKKATETSGKSEALELEVKGDDSPPARAYAEYHKACLAGDSTKFLPLVVSRNQKEFASYDKNMRAMVIELLKMRPTKITIDKPVVTDDTATFTVKGVYTAVGISTGSIKMVFEDMKWKVAEDKWKISSE